jgi:hypothetical protein
VTTYPQGPYYAHIRVGRGRVTLCAIRLSPDRFVSGAAWCNPCDQFSRRKGRLIAEGRATCERTWAVHDCWPEDTPRDLLQCAAEHHDASVPSVWWARDEWQEPLDELVGARS